MFNQLFIGTVTPFSGALGNDKNGEEPIMIQVVAGVCVNRTVLSGTLAKRAGFEIGHTYLIQCRENGFDVTFGKDFTFIKVKELETGKDIIEASSNLGEAKIITVERPEGFEEAYTRKSVKVISERMKRVEEGKYIPVTQGSTFTDTRTAEESIEGSTTEGESVERQQEADVKMEKHLHDDKKNKAA